MNAPSDLTARSISSLGDVLAKDWDQCANPPHLPYSPFLCHDFLFALEQSGSAVPDTGWQGAHLLIEDASSNLLACMPLYLKMHSRGEFVFDHGWAEAFEHAGGRYFPKLLSAIPFTPVSGRRLLLKGTQHDEEAAALLIEAALALTKKYQLSSLHVNFIEHQQLDYFPQSRFLKRDGLQFHFENRGFNSFDDFLTSLSSRKRKAIRKERRRAVEAGLDIRHLTGSALRREHWDRFFEFYEDTGSRKWGVPYLTRDFFSQVSDRMADKILLVFAFCDDVAIAGALNFIGSDALYGRYWGASEYHPDLHFELCYYQAIDFAIEHGLKRVEAGAQGEHKLARGYLPTQTSSVHFLADPGFRSAVQQFLSNEQRYINMENEVLNEHSPFRKTTNEGAENICTQGGLMETRTYNIDGMTCGGCTSSLEKVLLQQAGIEKAIASHEENNCQITLDPALVNDKIIAEITSKAGFEFKGKSE